MIILYTDTFDLNGYLELNNDIGSTINISTRRASKSKTLDGKSIISDLGFSSADNDLLVRVSNITEENLNKLLDIQKFYPILNVSTKNGVFKCAIKTIRYDSLPIQIEILLKEKING